VLRKSVFGPAAVTAALAALVAATPTSGGAAEPRLADAKVVVRDNFFSPRSLMINPGDTVKWVWKGDNRHNVTFVKVPLGATKRSAHTRRRGRWFRTFRRPGQYKYVCTLFAGMRGSITVEEATQSGAAASDQALADREADAPR
jgi:plastocyanin